MITWLFGWAFPRRDEWGKMLLLPSQQVLDGWVHEGWRRCWSEWRERERKNILFFAEERGMQTHRVSQKNDKKGSVVGKKDKIRSKSWFNVQRCGIWMGMGWERGGDRGRAFLRRKIPLFFIDPHSRLFIPVNIFRKRDACRSKFQFLSHFSSTKKRQGDIRWKKACFFIKRPFSYTYYSINT